MADNPLFTLDADGRWRLAYDDRQWVVQKHRPGSGKTTTVAFVATTKRVLLDVMGEKGVSLSAEAATRLDTLTDSFRVFAGRPNISAAQARTPVLGTRTPERPAPARPAV